MSCGIVRLALDTCVVRYAVAFSDYVWDCDTESLSMPSFVHAGWEQQQDLLALGPVLRLARQTGMELVVTETALAELPPKAYYYGAELSDWWASIKSLRGYEEPAAVDCAFAAALEMRLLCFLPDAKDRRLLAEAVLERCDAFLTTDRRTIWRHREALKRLGLRVLRPSEMWHAICSG